MDRGSQSKKTIRGTGSAANAKNKYPMPAMSIPQLYRNFMFSSRKWIACREQLVFQDPPAWHCCRCDRSLGTYLLLPCHTPGIASYLREKSRDPFLACNSDVLCTMANSCSTANVTKGVQTDQKRKDSQEPDAAIVMHWLERATEAGCWNQVPHQ